MSQRYYNYHGVVSLEVGLINSDENPMSMKQPITINILTKIIFWNWKFFLLPNEMLKFSGFWTAQFNHSSVVKIYSLNIYRLMYSCRQQSSMSSANIYRRFSRRYRVSRSYSFTLSK